MHSLYPTGKETRDKIFDTVISLLGLVKQMHLSIVVLLFCKQSAALDSMSCNYQVNIENKKPWRTRLTLYSIDTNFNTTTDRF